MARGPLVGREAELAALVEAATDARAGHGSCMMLVGEPGIGKSRLVEELARVVAPEMDVVWGRAWEAGGAPAYWPWTQVLRAIQAPVTSPSVARVRGDATDAAPATADDRFLTFDAVTRHLVGAASVRPVAILLEDLHAADEPSLHMLAFVAGQLHRAPILIVGTYRDVEARLTAAAGAVLDRIARDARVVHPRRLGATDVAALAAAEPGLTLDAGAIATVFQRSEGNPLFAVELMRVFARRGAAALPASVRTAIREHMKAMPTELAPMLEAAAVVGRELSASVVADVSRRPLPEVLDGFARAVDLGVLVERGVGRFAFAHGLIAETLHADLQAGRRAELHLAVADALEREVIRPLAEIAHHLLDAGPDQAERAADTARLAAEHARRQLAFEPAAALIQRVLATAPPSTQLARFELQRLLAEVLLLGGADAAGKDAAREAAAIARALTSPELIARAALTYGVGYSVGYTDQVLVNLLEEGLAALPSGDSPLRARLLARLAAALTPALDMAPVMRIARDAIAMAQRLGDDRTRLEVIYAAMSALLPFAPPAERKAFNSEVLALAKRFDEPLIELRSHHRLVFDHAELGEHAGFDLHRNLYDALVERLRLPRARWPSVMFRALAALLVGRLDEHAALLVEARKLAHEVGDTFFDNHAAIGHAFVHARVIGDDAYLSRDREAITRFAGQGPIARIPELVAAILVRTGQLDAARQVAIDGGIFEAARLYGLPHLGMCAAEVAWELGEVEGARTLYAWISAETPPFPALHNHGYALDRPMAHAAMQLAATLGNLTAARKHFESCRSLLQRLDARPFEAWLCLDFARILIAGGERGDEPRRLLVRAREINDALGMLIARRIDTAEALLAQPVAEHVVRDETAPPHVQLRADGETWVIDGLGTSARLKPSRGIEMLAKLIAEPNRELHVLDLAGADIVDGGDAGEVLDAEAKRAYKARIGELHEMLDQAESWNNTIRAERVRDELEALESELARAMGLGGRDRRVGKAAERARINVQRRIADAIKRIGEVNDELGRHLAATVKTGTWCSYGPDRATRPTR